MDTGSLNSSTTYRRSELVHNYISSMPEELLNINKDTTLLIDGLSDNRLLFFTFIFSSVLLKCFYAS